MNKISREEIAIIAIFALSLLIIGAVAGWSVRAVSSRDQLLIATATKHFTDAELSQRQIDQIIKEGSKPLKGDSNGKKQN